MSFFKNIFNEKYMMDVRVFKAVDLLKKAIESKTYVLHGGPMLISIDNRNNQLNDIDIIFYVNRKKHDIYHYNEINKFNNNTITNLRGYELLPEGSDIFQIPDRIDPDTSEIIYETVYVNIYKISLHHKEKRLKLFYEDIIINNGSIFREIFTEFPNMRAVMKIKTDKGYKYYF